VKVFRIEGAGKEEGDFLSFWEKVGFCRTNFHGVVGTHDLVWAQEVEGSYWGNQEKRVVGAGGFSMIGWVGWGWGVVLVKKNKGAGREKLGHRRSGKTLFGGAEIQKAQSSKPNYNERRGGG